MDDSNLISWKPEPTFRGTFSIFTSCLSTLTICVWSALHLDVQKGKSRKMRYLTKAGWLLIGILCPELLLITAFNQLVEAIHLTIDGQILLQVDGDEESYQSLSWVYRWLAGGKLEYESLFRRTSRSDQESIRKHPWTLTHGFYAAMGGFVLHDPYLPKPKDNYLPSWQRNGVLTPEGVRFLMEHAPEFIPDLAPDDILDRSKADGLAKALLVWQVFWFLLTCVNRAAQGLPLSLLEVSTIAHAFCSLITYALWWEKPKGIDHPSAILATPEARPIGAWMSMASQADRYLMGGLLQVEYPCEMTYVALVEAVDGDTRTGQFSFQRPPEVPRHNKEQRDTAQSSFAHRLRRMVDTWRLRRIFGAKTLPWYVDASLETSKEQRATEQRMALASEARQRYCLPQPTTSDAVPLRLVTPLASLQAFARNRQYSSEDIKRTALIVAVLAVVYGLPHFIGLTTTFPSARERTLWIVATVFILVLFAALGIVLSGIVGAFLGVLRLLIKVATVLQRWTHRRQTDRVDPGARETGIVRALRLTVNQLVLYGRLLTILAVVVYFFASGYLVVESVRQLFALPPGAFALASWGNYWPHFS